MRLWAATRASPQQCTVRADELQVWVGHATALATLSRPLFSVLQTVHALSETVSSDTVSSEIEQAQQMGVTGVPCFIIDMKYAVVGAQPAGALVEAMRKIAAEKARQQAGDTPPDQA